MWRRPTFDSRKCQQLKSGFSVAWNSGILQFSNFHFAWSIIKRNPKHEWNKIMEVGDSIPQLIVFRGALVKHKFILNVIVFYNLLLGFWYLSKTWFVQLRMLESQHHMSFNITQLEAWIQRNWSNFCKHRLLLVNT